MQETAVLDVRALPWRPRAPVRRADTLRDSFDPLAGFDDIGGVLIGLALWLLIIIAAPLISLVLAAALFSIELPIVLLLGLLLAVIRFTGLIPWTVVIVNHATGEERRETYRALWVAAARIRAINTDRRVTVRWAWS